MPDDEGTDSSIPEAHALSDSLTYNDTCFRAFWYVRDLHNM